METFAIEYQYDPHSEAIAAIRPRHREFLGALKEEGKLIGSGPYTDGNGGALIVIRLPKPATIDDATAIMDRDPFWVDGAVTKRVVHTWNPVLNVFDEQ